jgi:hypothetical protein
MAQRCGGHTPAQIGLPIDAPINDVWSIPVFGPTSPSVRQAASARVVQRSNSDRPVAHRPWRTIQLRSNDKHTNVTVSVVQCRAERSRAHAAQDYLLHRPSLLYRAATYRRVLRPFPPRPPSQPSSNPVVGACYDRATEAPSLGR